MYCDNFSFLGAKVDIKSSVLLNFFLHSFQDCPKDFHGNWTCTEGNFGGFDLGTFIRRNCCYEPQLFDSDWNSVLCVSSSRSSYLGEFYEEQTKFDPVLSPASTSPKGNYRKDIDRFDKYSKDYLKGKCIL